MEDATRLDARFQLHGARSDEILVSFSTAQQWTRILAGKVPESRTLDCGQMRSASTMVATSPTTLRLKRSLSRDDSGVRLGRLATRKGHRVAADLPYRRHST